MDTRAAGSVALSAASPLPPQAGGMRSLGTLLSLLLVAGPAGGGSVPGVRVDPKAPQGALGGRIEYPDGVAPAMRICAVSGAGQRCIDSPPGRTLYRIDRLPDGDYQVVAHLGDSATPVAGHVEQVQCIRAPCPAQLATLSIVGGKEFGTADLNGFYAERADFPVLQ
jgi:hypothetical protein